MIRPVFSCLSLRPRHYSRLRASLLPPFQPSLADRRQTQDRVAKKCDPLRILFCGSDEFSCAALEALDTERMRNPFLIQSIDVVVRPGKGTGRGYKVIQHPPIRDLAKRLLLPIHERDTFTGWKMPESINLIIAVSFGLFVPPRLLRAAKYGGLNVHPSLLPDFRGPAPLHHTILHQWNSTGVTLQTLDDKAFDHGIVLEQTPLESPVPRGITVKGLQDLLTPLAVNMLVQGLRDGLHVPPLQDRGRVGEPAAPLASPHAPKITPRDRQFLLRPASSTYPLEPTVNHSEVLLRQQIIGPLWFKAKDKKGDLKRIIVVSASGRRPPKLDHSTPRPEQIVIHGEDQQGHSFIQRVDVYSETGDGSIWIPGWSGMGVALETLKIEGQRAKPAKQVLAQLKLYETPREL
ncbi:formyl transferase [Pseudomassariella vexata]|uniref:methionyl-tRNA formyltransferase n=1 Tax=Pseudomassariella vexata TaxID=1141098 RepID=A0A1Y2DUQ0_9PEZI|nr:formyl transferase [Pseudomassariella vexata]ORY63000.1 formyl transferase [Pseudomassariella vexata]